MDTDNKEEWRSVVGYEGLYEISSLGRLKSLQRKLLCKLQIIEKRNTTPKGYIRVALKKDGKLKQYMLHRLVAFAFINNPCKKEYVNHLDGNKLNNRVNNLEWCTNEENAAHALKTGLCESKGQRGGAHYNAKIVLDMQTGIFYDFTGDAAIAKGLNRGTLLSMLSGHDRNWTSLRYV